MEAAVQDKNSVQRARHVLVTLLMAFFVAAMTEARTLGPWALFLSTLLFAGLQNFLPFYWYRLDSDRRAWRRSRWMNSAVVLLAPLAIPLYLVRSRAPGQRLRALLRFMGFVLLLMLAAGLGLFAGELSGGTVV